MHTAGPRACLPDFWVKTQKKWLQEQQGQEPTGQNAAAWGAGRTLRKGRDEAEGSGMRGHSGSQALRHLPAGEVVPLVAPGKEAHPPTDVWKDPLATKTKNQGTARASQEARDSPGRRCWCGEKGTGPSRLYVPSFDSGALLTLEPSPLPGLASTCSQEAAHL